MSVDIVGATRFKEGLSSVNGRPAWLTAFETFYRDLPLVLMGRLAASFEDADTLPDVDVWKVLGDEVLFRARPRSAEEALRLVVAFYRTVVDYDRQFLERWPLRVRGTCWAARFPGRNIEVQIPEVRGDGTEYIDYLGPDVDAGFRIASRGEAGNLFISGNLAEALARLPDWRGLRFHFVGRAVLRGVFAGRPYPLILVTHEDLPPDLWRWEVEESPVVRALRDEPPMPAADLIAMIEKIRNYLNRTCRLDLTVLEF